MSVYYISVCKYGACMCVYMHPLVVFMLNINICAVAICVCCSFVEITASKTRRVHTAAAAVGLLLEPVDQENANI